MMRGTTPTIRCIMPFDTSILKEVWITFSQHGEEVFTLTTEDVQLLGDTITARLSQEQTLSLNSNCKIEVQIRGKTTDDQAIGSKVKEDWMDRILKEGVI